MNNLDSIEKKIDLNKIINDMYKKFGKDGLTELEMTRYLYIELGKLFRFNLNYITAFELKQEDIYFNYISDYDDIPTNNCVCVQMSDIYVEILKRVGIEAITKPDFKAAEDYEMPHKYTVIRLKDGREIVADMIYDLPYIQLGLRTWNFAKNSEDGQRVILSDDEIKLLDDKIEYTYQFFEEKVYTESFIEMIKEEMNDPKKMREYVKDVYEGEEYREENLIGYKLDLIKNFINLQAMGGHEGSKVLGILYKNFFSEEERKKMSFVLLCAEPYEDHKIGDVEKLVCYCFKKNENECQYYAYQEGGTLEKVSREKLEEQLKSKKYLILKKRNLDEKQYGDDIFKR